MIDSAELVWYLSQGLSTFEKSTTGAILDKLELESCTSRKCRKCGGEGIVDEPFTCPNPKDPARTITIQLGAWCGKCRGIGVEPVFLTADEQKLVDGGEWVSQNTEGTRSAVPDETLIRFASVSRILSALDSSVRDALIAAYGDEGEELSHGISGRSFALTPLTKAGKALLELERERKSTSDDVGPEKPVQCLLALSRMDKGKRDPERTKLLAKAIKQAEKKLSQAEATWDLVVGGLSDEECAQ